MRGFKAVLVGVLGLIFICGLAMAYAAQVESNTKMRSVTGKISWIDVKLGKLQLDSDAGQDTRGISEYRINQDETRVTDPTDKKFLVIKDLQSGQHITIKLIDAPDEVLIRKIIADPMPKPVLQEATGELVAIDVQAGTLAIQEEPLPEEGTKGKLTYFVFDPKEIVVMRSPSAEPVRLELNPGDLIRVQFVAKNGKRDARSITLLKAASESTRTTTTTTTRTTVTE